MGNLVQASGRWSNSQVNQPYRAGAVNVYLVDAQRIPSGNPLQDQGVPLDRDSLAGNALAHEPTGIVLVDTGLLKSLITAGIITSATDRDIVAVVGAMHAEGLDAYRDIWDPERNPGLLSAGYAEPWVVKASGAAAFALAHEMGHLALGAKDPKRMRMPMSKPFDLADRDAHWACADLVQEKYRRQQEIEQAADDFAVDLLSKILFPDGVLPEPKLRYEIGAHWYILYGMAEQMVRTLEATESANVRRMLQAPVRARGLRCPGRTQARGWEGFDQGLLPRVPPGQCPACLSEPEPAGPVALQRRCRLAPGPGRPDGVAGHGGRRRVS